MKTILSEISNSGKKIREILDSDLRFPHLAGWALFFLGLYLVINVFNTGADRTIYSLNLFTRVIAAVIAFSSAVNLWYQKREDTEEGRSWGIFAGGFFLFIAAEAIWSGLSISGNSPPGASIADLAWLAGIVCLLAGLYGHGVNFKRENYSPSEQVVLAVFLGLSALLAIGLALIPNLVNFDTSQITETLLRMLYPLADLTLVTLAALVMLSRHGMYRAPWLFVVASFFARLLGNALFGLSAASGQYYPEGTTSLLTSFASSLYLAGYGIYALGVYVFDIIRRREDPLPKSKPVVEQGILAGERELTANTSALLFTDENDMVIQTSENFRFIMRQASGVEINGTPLQTVLGITNEEYNTFKNTLITQKSVHDFAVRPSHLGKLARAWLTAIPSYDVLKRFNGMNMVVRIFSESRAGTLLTYEERALVEGILAAAGAQGEDSRQLMVDYFNANYKMLCDLAIRNSGLRVVTEMTNQLNNFALRNKWTVRVENREIMLTGKLELRDVGKIIRALLLSARGQVARAIGPEIVEKETARFNLAIDVSTRALVDQYKLGGMA